MKKCPYCAEEIQDEAIKCRYCRMDLVGPPPQTAAPVPVPAPTPEPAWPSPAPTPEPAWPSPVPTPASPGVPTVVPPVQPTVVSAAAQAVVGEGALRFSHSGERYVLGYGRDSFGIWDRTMAGGPVMTYPRNDEGWDQAWHRFIGLEPRAIQVPSGGTPPPDVRVSAGPYQPGHVLAQWIVGLIVLSVFVSVVDVVFRAQRLSLVLRIRDLGGGSVTFAEANAADDRVVAMAIVGGIVILAAGIVWLIWQHRSQTNLRALGAGDLRFTPGWAVGWWLIPFMWWAMPYLTVRELHKASDPAAGAVDWPAKRTWVLLAFWWATWVGQSLLGSVAATYGGSKSPSISQVITSDSFGIAAVSVRIVAAVLAILVVRSIDARQQAKRARRVELASQAWQAGADLGG